jgi:hypothetical protein
VQGAVPISQPLNASLMVERGLRGPRAVTWLAWAIVGGASTYADKIHQLAGVSAYPNSDWVGERLPVSPAYVASGIGFFALYALVVGLRKGSSALFGGAHRSPAQVAAVVAQLLLVYAVSAIGGAYQGGKGVGPFLVAVVLAGWAVPALWRLRRTAIPAYAGLVIAFGCGFEWLATSHQAFVYPVCPATACFGTTIPILWLPWVYAHVALLFHRMAGGPSSNLV